MSPPLIGRLSGSRAPDRSECCKETVLTELLGCFSLAREINLTWGDGDAGRRDVGAVRVGGFGGKRFGEWDLGLGTQDFGASQSMEG